MIQGTDVLSIPDLAPGCWHIYRVQYGAPQRYQLQFQHSIIMSSGGRDETTKSL